VSKKRATADRKAKLEEVRRDQQAAERRRTLLVAGMAGAVVLALVIAVGVVIRNQLASTDIAKVGASAALAGCDPVTNDPATGISDHVGPGTKSPNVTSVKYATVPPSSGQHFAVPVTSPHAFYTAADRPQLENLVHNLEHGYTIVWYDEKLPKVEQDQLRKLAPLARDPKNAGSKFIVSAWDPARGSFPAGKLVAVAHWGAKQGHRQLCGKVSGEQIKAFVQKFPYTDSPEPNAE
jgi:hypothetical protein